MCKWIVDADQIQMSDYDSSLLYQNDLVTSFVFNETKLGIEGPKGLGKTFLMKSKRMVSNGKGIFCIPQNAMCDILDKVTFEESLSKYLEDYTNWVDLWKLAICISIHKSCLRSDSETESLRTMLIDNSDETYWDIYNSPYLVTPCQIMNELLNKSRFYIRNAQTRIPTYIAILRTIHRPIHIFIDKTDQALRDNLHLIIGSTKVSRGPINRSFWSYGQIALAEAAYQIYIQNSHIKVFHSIRSEAMLGAESYSDLFLQLTSYIVKLEYSAHDIKNMFSQYVMVEDDNWLVSPLDRLKDIEKAFVGVSSIKHGYVKNTDGTYKEESVFNYIFRHSLKRPRDIMHICYRLCYSQLGTCTTNEERMRVIRHVVNKESRLLLQSYMREMGPFIFDNEAEKWNMLWQTIDTNIFTYDYARDICATINSLGIDSCKDCKSCKMFMPCSSLYNAGLLGVIAKNNVDNDEWRIHFKSTGEVVINSVGEILPRNSELYFLHPMLTNKIEATRLEENNNFDLCRELIVGDGYEIKTSVIAKLIRIEDERKNRKRANTIFVSSTCFDLSDYRRMIFMELGRYDFRVFMSEMNDFGMPTTDINSYDYCLDKVKECSQLIFIVGERYGGEYRGTKYKDLADEIQKMNPALGVPSISMMEFFLAKKSGLTTRVFTKKDIYNERSTYEKNKDNGGFRPAFVRDTRVFEILSTITRMKSGNWFKTYEDIEDLREIIKIEFGRTISSSRIIGT